jgi:hypothetical protein
MPLAGRNSADHQPDNEDERSDAHGDPPAVHFLKAKEDDAAPAPGQAG